MYYVVEELNGKPLYEWPAQNSVADCRGDIEEISHKVAPGTVFSIYDKNNSVVDRVVNDELRDRLESDFPVC